MVFVFWASVVRDAGFGGWLADGCWLLVVDRLFVSSFSVWVVDVGVLDVGRRPFACRLMAGCFGWLAWLAGLCAGCLRRGWGWPGQKPGPSRHLGPGSRLWLAFGWLALLAWLSWLAVPALAASRVLIQSLIRSLIRLLIQLPIQSLIR